MNMSKEAAYLKIKDSGESFDLFLYEVGDKLEYEPEELETWLDIQGSLLGYSSENIDWI